MHVHFYYMLQNARVNKMHKASKIIIDSFLTPISLKYDIVMPTLVLIKIWRLNHMLYELLDLITHIIKNL